MDYSSWHGSFLSHLPPRYREKVLALAQSFHYMPGEVIFQEGDPALFLYVVKSGQVVLEIDVPPRGRVSIQSVNPGDLFSWSALVEPRVETAAARAVEETEVLGIRGGALSDLCMEDSKVGFEVYRVLSRVITERLVATRLQLLDMFSHA